MNKVNVIASSVEQKHPFYFPVSGAAELPVVGEGLMVYTGADERQGVFYACTSRVTEVLPTVVEDGKEVVRFKTKNNQYVMVVEGKA